MAIPKSAVFMYPTLLYIEANKLGYSSLEHQWQMSFIYSNATDNFNCGQVIKNDYKFS